MAISKLILNGETQMDVTSNTNTSNNMLSGVVGTKNDGTSVTGNIASKSSSDLTISGATVTAPAGYYANAASKAVTTATHPNPSASIASATGVVTASHTQDTGYVTGGTTTGTLNLTTQASKTVTPTESAQTAVASYRWTTGDVNVAAISSTYVGTGISQRSAADITQNANEITAPMGYYSQSTTYTVPTYSHTSPSIAFTSSTGKIKATHNATNAMQNWGMLTGYTTTSSEYTLTTQATQDFYPSTADQAIARYRWLTGQQTFKSVITTNLTAANIAEGVVVKVGDVDNASRITQVTGTHKSGGYTCTVTNGILSTRCVKYNNTNYASDEIIFNKDEVLTIHVSGNGTRDAYLYINDNVIIGPVQTSIDYNITPNVDFSVNFTSGNNAYKAYVTIPEIDITENGTYEVGGYGYANVSVGGAFTIDDIAMRTISGNISGSATLIGPYAFAYCQSLTTVNFPSCSSIDAYVFGDCYSLTTASFSACTYINASAFHHCTRLTTVSFPACTYIGGSAFAFCTSLTSVSFPSCSSIGTSAFANCSSLTTVSFPLCSYIGSYAFRNCSSLTTMNFPSCTSIGPYAFANCSSLTTVSFPLCSSIGGSAFSYCSRLTTVSFPSCKIIGSFAFGNCYSLTTVSFPSCKSISAYAFTYCYNLLSLYLLGSSVPSLAVNVFTSTPITGYTTSTGGVYGSIFVPASLYSSYLTATNWSVYSARIVSVQGGVILNYSGATTSIIDNKGDYNVSGYGRLIGPLSWNTTPIVGMTYQVNITYYRQRNNRTYSFNGELVWNGYGSTYITLTNANTIYAFPEAEQLTVVVTNVDDDITGDTYSITMEL